MGGLHDAIRDQVDDTMASLEKAHPGEYEWLRVCLSNSRHSGTDCWRIFAPGAQEHSKHLSARWKSSLSLRWFLITNTTRRWAYTGHQKRMQNRRKPR